MPRPDLRVVYHGTSKEGAKALVNRGIDMRQTQSRDSGFFGEGFYVTTEKEFASHHATNNAEPAIVEISLSSSASILNAGETFSGGPVPTAPPSWHESFIDWYIEKLEEAAVWERIDGKSRSDIVPSGKKKQTPGTEEFNRTKWYENVTEYAEEQGHDVVYWSDSEVIIKNPDVVTNITQI